MGPTQARLDAACVALGRDPSTLGRSLAISVAPLGAAAEDGTLTGTPEEIAAGLASYAELRIDHLQLMLANPTPARVEAFGAVFEAFDRR